MISTSEEYKSLMSSNIRPKCEPVIVLSGTDSDGRQVELTWNAKDIKEMKYSRGIDPIGRELPFMELTWTEIYTGKLNAHSYPEKYDNIVKYMKVELTFVQNLGFFNTWKLLKNSGSTWKSIFTSGKTWRDIKNSVGVERITVPTLFLTARPIIEGQQITWVARDLISFLGDQQVKRFYANPDHYLNPVLNLLINARAGFLNSKELFRALTDTVTENLSRELRFPLEDAILCDLSTKDALKNFLSLYNMHWNFVGNIALATEMEKYINEYDEDNSYYINKNLLYDYPNISVGTDISSYEFKNYVMEEYPQGSYMKSPNSTYSDFGMTIYRTNYNGYGIANSGNVASEINYGISILGDNIEITPINYNSYDNTIRQNIVGEPFIEDNPLNPYDSKSLSAKQRFMFLNWYFKSEYSVLTFTSLANPALEAGDIIKVDTNLYEGNHQLTKTAMIIEMNIEYNGSIKEKFICHELGVI